MIALIVTNVTDAVRPHTHSSCVKSQRLDKKRVEIMVTSLVVERGAPLTRLPTPVKADILELFL